MKKTKIVCTIGPASESVDVLVKMINAGMDVARLNFSHGTHEEHLQRIKNIREAEKITGVKIGLMLDTKGSEVRTHTMENDEIYLPHGKEVRISMTEVVGTPDKISVSFSELINEVSVGTNILIDDGLLDFEVTSIDDEANEIVTVVKNPGTLRNRKGVNVPTANLSLPSLTDQDIQDIKFGLSQGINFIAASFVRRVEDVIEISSVLEDENAENIHIIPKIENAEGYANIESILKVSDGIMVARGDLGVEIPPEQVPIVQKELIRACNKVGKPVITATHMLESMTDQPFPTRAEANDVANAIFDHSDAVMLSGETAAGKYPVESVRTMARIAITAENASNELAPKPMNIETQDITETIGQAVSSAVSNLKIKTIVVTTGSGYTARMISKYRPDANIIAVTFSKEVARRLKLQWGVSPIVSEQIDSTDDMFKFAGEVAVQENFAQLGDTIIITAGIPLGESGTTNLMKIQVIGEEVLLGEGIGDQSAVGKAVISDNLKDGLDDISAGDILIVKQTIPEIADIKDKLAGLVIENTGIANEAVISGLSLNIPIIVGAKNAKKKIENGETISLDAKRGVVYRGKVSM